MTQDVALVYRPELDDYELGPGHPLKPARVTNTVSLIRAYGLLDGEDPGTAAVVEPESAGDNDLLLVHSPEYVEAVKAASRDPHGFRPMMGLGTGDNPIAAGMHDVAALICGGAITGLADVLEGRFRRTFNVAGGLHHAHRARAAGFCVYNDPAVAIARALADGLASRILYIDIDAHHGDGVEEAFYDDARVMTISLHQTGRTLFPGTGFAADIGAGEGCGYAANVALPPLATDDCFTLAFEEIVIPLAGSFNPDVIVLQGGADANHADPLTMLGLTLGGYLRLASAVCDLADELCDGRLAACGGGGYAFCTVVPLAWTALFANLLEVELPDEIPEAWEPDCAGAPDMRRPVSLTRHDTFPISTLDAQRLYEATRESIAATRRALAPYHEFL